MNSMQEIHTAYINKALDLACESAGNGRGGPFGCVVVRGDEIIGQGQNIVTSANDPTAHAEIEAIREACGRLESFQLKGCTIYASCEPCPMCLGAIYWARPDAVYFAASREDAARAGFDDAFIYRQIGRPTSDRNISMAQLRLDDATEPFRLWEDYPDKKRY